MKRAMLAVAFIAPAALLFAQDRKKESPFAIQGTVAELKQPAKIFLKIRRGDDSLLDSAVVKDGKFSFKGAICEPSLATLVVIPEHDLQPSKSMPAKRDMRMLFLDKGTIIITARDSISKAEVKGSAANEDYEQLNGMLRDVTDQMKALQKEYKQLYMARDEEGMKKLEPKFDELEARQKKVLSAYLEQHPRSPIAMYVLNQYAGYEINTAEVEPIYKKLHKKIRRSVAGEAFAKRLEAASKTSVGQPAIDFSQSDAEGKSVSLSSLRGKYVLVDFWASWCGPCRAENPNVVKAYNKFKEKGFEILAVSLDDKKDKWLAAVQADNLTWLHVSDLKGWKNAVAELYSIRAIPQNLLVDPKGLIIAKNLRGDALESKLEEIIK